METYNLTNKAVEDLNNIWEYTLKHWSEAQADKYYVHLLNNFQRIADNPELGKNYAGIKNNLFGLKTHRHIIFYRKLINKPIEITRILHDKMDIKSRIND